MAFRAVTYANIASYKNLAVYLDKMGVVWSAN